MWDTRRLSIRGRLRVTLSGAIRIPIRVTLHDMGSCQNYGPFWGTLNNLCRIIIRTHKGTIILTTTHISCNDLLQWWSSRFKAPEPPS